MSEMRWHECDATVASVGRHRMTILVDDLVLGDRYACHVQCVAQPVGQDKITDPGADKALQRGLAISMDRRSGVIVLGSAVPGCSVGESMQVSYQLQRDTTSESFEHAAQRLRRLLMDDDVAMKDRACRHALLYVMEAHDPSVRGLRLELLRQSLSRASDAATAAVHSQARSS